LNEFTLVMFLTFETTAVGLTRYCWCCWNNIMVRHAIKLCYLYEKSVWMVCDQQQ